MKKVISFSLWGDNRNYLIGAIRNAELVNDFFPGWICRFYVDEKLNKTIIDTLLSLNSEIIYKNYTHEFEPYLWRFLSASDPEVEVMISRDCDSRLTLREKIAVDEWLQSDKDFHIIRDHPHHNYLIMAGMWGVRNNILSNMTELIGEWKNIDTKQNDQKFLANIIYPKVRKTLFIHDDFVRFESDKHKIKHDRVNYEYIGEYYDENEKCSEHHKMELKKFI